MEAVWEWLAKGGTGFWASFYLLLMSSVATFVFTYVSKQNKTIKELKDKYDDLLDLTFALTIYNLKNFNEDCQTQGFADEGERDEFMEIYDKYKKLKGNGIAKSIKSEFIKLYEKTGKLGLKERYEISKKTENEIVSEVIKIINERFENDKICLEKQKNNE